MKGKLASRIAAHLKYAELDALSTTSPNTTHDEQWCGGALKVGYQSFCVVPLEGAASAIADGADKVFFSRWGSGLPDNFKASQRDKWPIGDHRLQNICDQQPIVLLGGCLSSSAIQLATDSAAGTRIED